MRLVLTVPGLLAFPSERLAATRSLAALASAAPAPNVDGRGIAAALLAAIGAAPDVAAGPLAMLGANGEPGGDYVLCADPVHLAADRDTVVLVRRVDDLSAEAANALVRTLNRHFAEDDLRFESLRPDAWFARRTQRAAIATTSVDAALGRTLLASLPRGDDAGRWRRWQNEIEMLLHDHAVNAEREARGAPPVSGVWFWGGGTLADAAALPRITAAVAPGPLGDLARGVARAGRGDARALDATETLDAVIARTRSGGNAAHALVVLPAAATDFARLEANWLAPALECFAQGDVEALTIVADGHGAAATWSARHRPTFWQRVVSRTARRRFVIPSLPDA